MKIALLSIGLVLAGPNTFAQSHTQNQSVANCKKFEIAVTKGEARQSLKRFLDVQWAYELEEYPEQGTYLGIPGRNSLFTDNSLTALDRRNKEEICQLKAVQKIRRAALSDEDKISLDLLLEGLKDGVEGQQFDSQYLAISHLSGLHLFLPRLLEAMPNSKASDFDDILSRLEKIPEVAEQHQALLKEGLKKKITPVRLFLEKVPAQFDAVLTKNVEDSPLFNAFKEINASIPASEQKRIREKAKQILTEKSFPALAAYRDFLIKEYIPGAKTSTAWADMPNGKKWYEYKIKTQTTTQKTAEELHQIGLNEVDRINTEMLAIRQELKFKGDSQAFHKMLLTDSKFYFDDPTDLLISYRDIAKRLDAELPRLFGRLPRLTYGVRAIPEYQAKSAPTAYYYPGNPKAGRPGFFETNTFDLKARPKWGMEALTIHEAVPGHHLQIALAQEMDNLPEFRKNGGYTAYVEGWALYAESLGSEMGFYKDPYAKYGSLVYELWRAVRLVVDTGLHTKGWSRDQAIDYFMKQLPKTRLEAEVEVDRYITWPAQALAYKVGQMKFQELRELTKKELGDKFSVRDFHDEVLRHGALPIDVLDRLTKNWIAAQKKPKKN